MPKSGQIWDPKFLLGHPLFEVFEPLAKQLRLPEFPEVAELTALMESERSKRAPEARPLRFAQLVKKPRREKRSQIVLDELYDGSIQLRGTVPCLSQSYHDLFNALAFSAFVRAKRALHLRQFNALKNWIGTAPQLPGRRTREQDALTIFDEGGVVLLMAEPFLSRWRNSSEPLAVPPFMPKSGVIPLLFGHALLEHLFEGHAQVRASAVIIAVDSTSKTQSILETADRHLEERLTDPEQFTAPGADGIFYLDQTHIRIGPPKPSWTAWTPGDRAKFQSCYAPAPEQV